jgi:hypothetical protein
MSVAKKVQNEPTIPNPYALTKFQDVQTYLTNLVQSLKSILRDDAARLNVAVMGDGSEQAQFPIIANEYVKAALPSAVTYKSGIITVSDDVGGYVLAFSDGTNWRRVTDRNVIS